MFSGDCSFSSGDDSSDEESDKCPFCFLLECSNSPSYSDFDSWSGVLNFGSPREKSKASSINASLVLNL